jgi:hypothetical protein
VQQALYSTGVPRALFNTGIEKPFRVQEYSSHIQSSTAWNSTLVQQPSIGQKYSSPEENSSAAPLYRTGVHQHCAEQEYSSNAQKITVI